MPAVKRKFRISLGLEFQFPNPEFQNRAGHSTRHRQMLDSRPTRIYGAPISGVGLQAEMTPLDSADFRWASKTSKAMLTCWPCVSRGLDDRA